MKFLKKHLFTIVLVNLPLFVYSFSDKGVNAYNEGFHQECLGNYLEAIECYKQAEEDGIAMATIKLAYFFAEGHGYVKNMYFAHAAIDRALKNFKDNNLSYSLYGETEPYTYQNCLNCKGEFYIMEGNFEKALPIWEEQKDNPSERIQNSPFILKMKEYIHKQKSYEDNISNLRNSQFTGQTNSKDLPNIEYQNDLDINIPKNSIKNNSSTFAFIIANENYNVVSDVPYAKRDGQILAKYLTQCIGLPKDHVKIYENASFGNFAAVLKQIENLSKAFGSDLNLIFYYSGHGIPNEQTKNPMLIPIDGDAAIPETCYDLGKVVTTLGRLNANSVIVMLDACFSGTERGDGMLMAARGIRIKSNQSEPIGNMVILSASQGDETAYPFDTEQHGLFTYFLLKKLQENKGDVTLGELTDYITEQVKRQSVVSNGKLQTPTLSVSPVLKDNWRNQKFGR